ncbi:MAG: protein kinase, partial [Cyanothece sp. SIO1E1]|nr:protein kinase [Cyanothece sp. SIO1E1]
PIDFTIAMARIQAQLTTLQASRQERKQAVHQTMHAYTQQALQTRHQQRIQAPVPSQKFTDTKIGAPVSNRYQMIRLFKKDALSQTFVAEDIQESTLCLLQRIRFSPEVAKSFGQIHQLFQSEIKLLEQLSQFYQNQIPRFLNFFTEAQDFYLVQEFRKGFLLSDELEKSGPLPPLEVLDLTISILRVLKSIHYRKLIHSDIQPCHLLQCQDNRKLIILTDFGIANRIFMQLRQDFSYQGQKIFKLSGYTAPEQCAGQLTFSSDLYAVGMIALQALTGKKPETFTIDANTGELNWQQFIQLDPDLSQFLAQLVCQNHQKRFASVNTAIRDALFRRHALYQKGS